MDLEGYDVGAEENEVSSTMDLNHIQSKGWCMKNLEASFDPEVEKLLPKQKAGMKCYLCKNQAPLY